MEVSAVPCCELDGLSNSKQQCFHQKASVFSFGFASKDCKNICPTNELRKNTPKGKEIGSFLTFAFLYIYNFSERKPQGAIKLLGILYVAVETRV